MTCSNSKVNRKNVLEAIKVANDNGCPINGRDKFVRANMICSLQDWKPECRDEVVKIIDDLIRDFIVALNKASRQLTPISHKDRTLLRKGTAKHAESVKKQEERQRRIDKARQSSKLQRKLALSA